LEGDGRIFTVFIGGVERKKPLKSGAFFGWLVETAPTLKPQ
jgi:hypothetical protein